MDVSANSTNEQAANEVETEVSKKLETVQIFDANASSESDSKVQIAPEKVEDDDSKMSKAEKRSRQILGKLNLELVPGISQVVMRQKPDLAIIFNKPEVYRYKNVLSDNYVIFGKYETRNLGIWPGYRALQNTSSSAVEYLLNPDYAKYERAQETLAVTLDENDLGEGISDTDIELVMSQSDCSKSAAIKALRDADGDLVSAILSLAN